MFRRNSEIFFYCVCPHLQSSDYEVEVLNLFSGVSRSEKSGNSISIYANIHLYPLGYPNPEKLIIKKKRGLEISY